MRRLSGPNNLPRSAFRERLASASSIAIVADTDLDGLGAARLLTHSSFGPRVGLLLTTDRPDRSLSDENEARILAFAPDLVVFLDIAPTNLPQLRRLLAGRSGLIVDHHKPQGLSEVPELDARFIAYSLFPENPDRFSTTYLLAELLDEPYDPQFVVAALLGDENFEHHQSHFETTAEERALAYRLAVLYKKLGSTKTLGPEGQPLPDYLGLTLERLAIETTSLQALDAAIRGDSRIQDFLLEETRESARLLAEALSATKEAGEARELLVEFEPRTGFFTSGFIYTLEKRVRAEHPAFQGLLIVAQKGTEFTRLDALSTDPSRSIGEILSHAKIGGGHRNVGGGRLPPGPEALRKWFGSLRSPGTSVSPLGIY